MLALAAPIFDQHGVLILHSVTHDSLRPEVVRRVSKVKTLDGGVSIHDTGHSYADVTLTIDMPYLTKTEVERLEYFVRRYPLVRVSVFWGVLLCVPERFTNTVPGGQLVLLAKEKLSA